MKWIALLWIVLLTGGCARGAQPPMERETFVAAMVELRQAAADTGDGFEAARAEVLERHGITAEQLHAYARWAGREPGRLREAFEEISARMREPREE